MKSSHGDLPDHEEPLLGGMSSYMPPGRDYYPTESPRDGCCVRSIKLFVFHFLNALLGIVAAAVVTTGVPLSIVLLPLCCFGLVIFFGVLECVRMFAQYDCMLYNLTLPRHEHVYVDIPHILPHGGVFEGQRVSPSLAFVSPRSLMATFYFGIIKPAMGSLSLAVFAMLIALPSALIALIATGDRSLATTASKLGITLQGSDVDPLVALAGLFALGLILSRPTAWLSRAVTRFFCCEQFETYHYVYVSATATPV